MGALITKVNRLERIHGTVLRARGCPACGAGGPRVTLRRIVSLREAEQLELCPACGGLLHQRHPVGTPYIRVASDRTNQPWRLSRDRAGGPRCA